MIVENPYYFDVLPIHPPPIHLESLTSYVMRLAQGNGIKTFSSLSAILFANSGRIIEKMRDQPLSQCETILSATNCPENLLLATTFYYSTKKFGRPSSPSFLSGCLATYLRYCPYCLESAYSYLLPWRFLILDGCPIHSCRLLEVCDLCGRAIPIVAVPFKVGTCPYCKADLRACKPQMLTNEELQMQVAIYKDLVFLLSPSPWDDLSNVFPIIIGSKLELLRQSKNLTLRDVRDNMNIGVASLMIMEHEYRKANASLKNYFSYFQYLGITFGGIFDTLQPNNYDKYIYQVNSEEYIFDLLKQSVVYLQEEGHKINYSIVSNHMKIPVSRLLKNAKVKIFMKQLRMRDKFKIKHEFNENKLLTIVTSAVQQLQKSECEITKTGVSKIAGISHTIFKYYPQVEAYLEEQIRIAAQQKVEAMFHNEQELLLQAQLIISQMQSLKQPITISKVAKKLLLPSVALHQHPVVMSVIEHAIRDVRRMSQRERKLILELKKFLKSVKIEDQPITMKSVSNAMGLKSGLYYYPIVLDIARQSIKEMNLQNSREAKLFKSAEDAIQQLHASNQRVTIYAVARKLRLPPSSLRNYPKVVKLIREEKKEKVHEQEIIGQVDKVIQKLKTIGKPLTIKNISAEVGRSGASLHYYPQVMVRIRTAIQEERDFINVRERNIQNKKHQVKLAIERLSVMKESLTTKIIAREAGIPQSTLYRQYPEVLLYIKQHLQEKDVDC